MQEGIEDESILHEVVVEGWWRTRITRIQGLWGLDGRRWWWREEGGRLDGVQLRNTTRDACKGCKEAPGAINEGLHLLKGIEEGGGRRKKARVE